MPDLVSSEHRTILSAIAASAEPALARRARLLLLYDDGHETPAVSDAVGLAPSTVRTWRRRYRAEGLGIFPDDAVAADAEASTNGSVDAAITLSTTGPPVPASEPQPTLKELYQVGAKLTGKKKRVRSFRKAGKRKGLRKLRRLLKDERARLKRKLQKRSLKKKRAKKVRRLRKAMKAHIQRIDVYLGARAPKPGA